MTDLLSLQAADGDAIDQAVATSRTALEKAAKQKGLQFSAVSNLLGKPIPEREWLVPGWLPLEIVALLYGAGGQGKTLLAQMLMASVAAGRPWLGLPVRQGRAIGLFTEDDEAELHRRQEAINRDLGIGYVDLKDMFWTCPIGTDNTLIRFLANGTAMPTARYLDFKRQAVNFQPILIVLDIASDLYGGNENDRGQVAQFLKSMLGDLARETGALVLLTAHPSKSSIVNGDLDSGSTGWNGGVRARLTLVTPRDVGDGSVDQDARILTKAKLNYGRRGDELKLKFRDSVLCRDGGPGGSIVDSSNQRKCEAVFLELLDKLPAAGEHVSSSRNAGNYAPRIFGERPDRHGFKKRDFEIAMHALLALGGIRSEAYGKASNGTRHIVRTDANPNDYGPKDDFKKGDGLS